ncbi:TniB family NTP-binding protein [Hydrogenophaga sp. BPS33]|uniref:TniB family NTP-binding protein n=1 Tax=Hydrogenophaga sp. BPS33 TaxID=2651974 RepID=UPI00131FEA58|nr:TniB family NTP-binding protein [Hydrogenophaga sp. BPS33]QHE83385.1 AAA family ATPase [Hydrogenophaga sp. BPS33]
MTSQSFADLDAIEEKVSTFSNVLIQHAPLQAGIDALKVLMTASRHNRKKARGALIYGLSGAGKTTLCKCLEEQFPRYDADDRTIIPVLFVELPSQPTPKVIAEAILTAMGDPMAHSGTAEFRLSRVRTLLAACKVEIVLIDEVQHISDNLDGRTRDIASDTLKNLMNATGIPFVFLGLPSASKYFSNRMQLGRRLNPKIHLGVFSYDTDANQDLFATLLLSFHEKLPFSGKSALIDPVLTPLFHRACYGLIGSLAMLLEAAVRIALRARANSLTREHLRKAFGEEVYLGCKSNRNPFDEKFDHRPLVNVGEPFFGFGK